MSLCVGALTFMQSAVVDSTFQSSSVVVAETVAQSVSSVCSQFLFDVLSLLLCAAMDALTCLIFFFCCSMPPA